MSLHLPVRVAGRVILKSTLKPSIGVRLGVFHDVPHLPVRVAGLAHLLKKESIKKGEYIGQKGEYTGQKGEYARLIWSKRRVTTDHRCPSTSAALVVRICSRRRVQSYLAHKKNPSPLGPPYEPRHSPTVGS